MRLNTLIAKAIRAEKDESLQKFFRKTIVDVLGCDQICFREDVQKQSHYKAQLGFEQQKRGDPLLKFMKDEYDIHLKTFGDYGFLEQDQSYLKMDRILANVDPWTLLCIYTIAQSTKSTVVAFALLNEVISLEDAILVSRLEEIFQQKFYGIVKGAHDYDEARTISDVSAAKCFMNLLQ
jgi:chaperone required for assembly of F1-ATPase